MLLIYNAILMYFRIAKSWANTLSFGGGTFSAAQTTEKTRHHAQTALSNPAKKHAYFTFSPFCKGEK
jgi:hypothetical protein